MNAFPPKKLQQLHAGHVHVDCIEQGTMSMFNSTILSRCVMNSKSLNHALRLHKSFEFVMVSP